MITLDDARPAGFAVPADRGDFGSHRSKAMTVPDAPPRLAVQVLEISLYACILSSFMTIIQPAPYEGLAAIVGFACLSRAIAHRRENHADGLSAVRPADRRRASLIPIIGDKDAETFVIISIYLAISGVIFAAVMTEDTARRFDIIRSAYIGAAVIAAILGMLGYFKAFPGSDVFLMNDRAVSTFKDPNITGPFYIPPLLFLITIFVTDRVRPHHLVASLIIAVGLLLAFSRAAWGQFVFATLLTLTLLFITRADWRARQRLVVMTLLAVAAVVAMLMVLFSIESVRDMILQRATLFQSYDTGTEGSRFNIQQRSIEMPLAHPNGMGPWVFARYYGLVSHNSYLGVFLNHGWIGGISYIALDRADPCGRFPLSLCADALARCDDRNLRGLCRARAGKLHRRYRPLAGILSSGRDDLGHVRRDRELRARAQDDERSRNISDDRLAYR